MPLRFFTTFILLKLAGNPESYPMNIFIRIHHAIFKLRQSSNDDRIRSINEHPHEGVSKVYMPQFVRLSESIDAMIACEEKYPVSDPDDGTSSLRCQKPTFGKPAKVMPIGLEKERDLFLQCGKKIERICIRRYRRFFWATKKTSTSDFRMRLGKKIKKTSIL